jgi:hypothetical protein
MKVIIIKFPLNQICRCNSWMNHYNKFSYRHVRMCVAVDCQEGRISGTHVQKSEMTDTIVDSVVTKSELTDSKIYILPLCEKHANELEELDIRPLSVFANANTKETCGSINFGVLKGTDL